MGWQWHISFWATPQGDMWLLPPPTHVCLFPFKQFIMQQMVQLQDSISKRLHHHTFFSMFFNRIFEAHHARIFSSFGLAYNLSNIPSFLINFPSFFHSTSYTTWITPSFNYRYLSICVCTHPIDLMGIHLLRCVHGNKCTWTYDVIHNTFTTIARDVGFHVGR